MTMWNMKQMTDWSRRFKVVQMKFQGEKGNCGNDGKMQGVNCFGLKVFQIRMGKE